jgi:hypothetical protein
VSIGESNVDRRFVAGSWGTDNGDGQEGGCGGCDGRRDRRCRLTVTFADPSPPGVKGVFVEIVELAIVADGQSAVALARNVPPPKLLASDVALLSKHGKSPLKKLSRITKSYPSDEQHSACYSVAI